jgi:phosphate transport system substrate-binding protein
VIRTSLRRVVAPGIAVTAILAMTACGAGNEGDNGSENDGGSGNSDSSDTGASDVTVDGQFTIGGASSQEAAQNAWTIGYTDVQPGATVTYEAIGSGGGRENFISGAYPLAGSDAYLVDEAPDNELSKATERCQGEAPIEVPNYVSPIAIAFNIEGVTELKLTPETLAGIFAGQITNWSDPALAEDNPGLPDAAINAVHRSDESGTTENFTNYLSSVAGDVWTAGEVETWPGEAGGEGAAQTSGVIDAITNGENSIGYADASQASELGQASIEVNGEFIDPTPEAAAAILSASEPAAEAGENQLVFDLNYTPDEAAYPIVLTSYLIACSTYEDEAEANFVRTYMEYVLSADGQQFGAEEAGVAPLAEDIESQALEIVGKISAG